MIIIILLNFFMKIIVKEIYLDKDIKEAFSIRRKVFVEGMNIPVEIELDKYDKVAHHIIAYADEIPAGAARWRKTKEGMKLERFAVLPKFRLLGIGKALTEYILKTLKNEKNIYLNSQHTAIGFYGSANNSFIRIFAINPNSDSSIGNWVGNGSDIWVSLTYFT